MGGSAKAPKESDSQRKLAQTQQEELERQKEEAENAKPLQIPKPPKILPTPPPPTSYSSDAVDAAEAQRQKAGGRVNSGNKTVYAGNTGGYRPGTLFAPATTADPLGGKRTLL